MDPVLAAMIAGATLMLQGTANEAVKDLYQGLKSLIDIRIKGDDGAELVLSKLEDNPDVWKSPLEELLSRIAIRQDHKILDAAQRLLECIEPGQINIRDQNTRITGDANTIIQAANLTIAYSLSDVPTEPNSAEEIVTAEEHFRLGNVALAANEYAQAIEEYSAAIFRSPNHANTHNNRGNAHYLRWTPLVGQIWCHLAEVH